MNRKNQYSPIMTTHPTPRRAKTFARGVQIGMTADPTRVRQLRQMLERSDPVAASWNAIGQEMQQALIVQRPKR